MAKDPQKEGWGTWEELLLAFAVERHGFKNWDSVASEVQSKSSLPRAQTTARNCRQKYHELNLRFANSVGRNKRMKPQAFPAAVQEETINIPWLEDLRKLRVAELKQEVHRYDASILSLQLKVKRLEEERRKSEEDRATTDLKQQESETNGNKKASLSVSVPDRRAVYASPMDMNFLNARWKQTPCVTGWRSSRRMNSNLSKDTINPSEKQTGRSQSPVVLKNNTLNRGGSNHGIVESSKKKTTGVEVKEITPRKNCEAKKSVGRPPKKATETKVKKILGKHKRDGDAERPRTRPRR